MRGLGGLVVLVAMLPDEAFAATRSVCASACDYTTFSGAVAGVAAGDTIEFRDSGTYGGADIAKNLTIQVQGTFTPTINTRVRIQGTTVSISRVRFAGSTNRCVEIDAGSNVTLTGLTIENCTSTGPGGGVYASVGGTATTIRLDTVLMQNNTGVGNGGHVSLVGNVAATVVGSTFLAVTCSGKGGAIAMDGNGTAPSLSISNSTFTGTSSTLNGGALWVNATTTSVTGSWFTNASTTAAAAYGGAVAVEGNRGLTAYRNVFCKNTAVTAAGAMWLAGSGADVVSNNLFVGNSTSAAGGAGGAISTPGGSSGSTISFNHFLNNSVAGTGSLGGSVYLIGTGDVFTNNLVAYGTNSAGAGGVHSNGAVTGAYDLWFTNTATDTAGGFTKGASDISGKDPVLNGYDSKSVVCGKSDIDKMYPEAFFPSKSPLIDAGDPAIKDLDGSRADIGAWGGPQADPAFWADSDKDGYLAFADCNDKDGSSYPGSLFVDADKDGFGSTTSAGFGCLVTGYSNKSGDCDDTKVAVNPTATEACNGFDDDCDKSVDETGATGSTTYYLDNDKDTYGSTTSKNECAQPTGWVTNSTDCDDTKGTVYPGAPELCSTAGVDDNCNGSKDENTATDAATWYVDADVDTYGGVTSQKSCTQPVGYVANNKDCDDTKKAVNPGVTELCSTVGVDDNCNGSKDENTASDVSTWYVDADADLYGTTSSLAQCTQPGGYTNKSGDCNDASKTVNPGAPEVCNATDDDCDGTADDGLTFLNYYVDADADGYGVDATKKSACLPITGYGTTPGDCDDGNAAVSPGDAEQCGNGVDDNCDGSGGPTVDDDGDGLNWQVEQAGGSHDCDADSDDDGLSDKLEYAGTTAIDSDGDGDVDALDPDDDGDGIATKDEVAAGSDWLAADTDNDLVPDGDEWGTAKTPRDTDGDGTEDVLDDDDDGDGIPTIDEGDGDRECLNKSCKLACDGIPNYLDLDADGDGKTDTSENSGDLDLDDDGTENYLDCNDSDGGLGDNDSDGLSNDDEKGLGTDPDEPDSDFDGVPDPTEVGAVTDPTDSDLDGTIDALDEDDDGDTFLTADELGDGPDPQDTDEDGTSDYLDEDDDGDDAPSGVELDGDVDEDGIPNYLDGNDEDGPVGDEDGDDLSNAEEAALGTDPLASDSDGDGVPDRLEVGDPTAATDSDGDGTIDALDTDDDGDGVPSDDEFDFDGDGDGVPSYLDTDSDNDGVPDAEEPDEDADCDGSPALLDRDEADGPCAQEPRIVDVVDVPSDPPPVCGASTVPAGGSGTLPSAVSLTLAAIGLSTLVRRKI